MKQNNVFIKSVIAQIFVEFPIAIESSVLKILVEEKINYEIPVERWNQIVKEIREVSGLILED